MMWRGRSNRKIRPLVTTEFREVSLGSLRVWGLLAESGLLRDRTHCTLNYSGNFLGMRGIDCVTGACDFDCVAMRSRGVPSFKVRVDGSVFFRDQHPAWFASPRGRGDDGLEVVRAVEHLRSCHESGLLRRKIGCKVLMKL